MLSNFSKIIFKLQPLLNSNRILWLKKIFLIKNAAINAAFTVYMEEPVSSENQVDKVWFSSEATV